MTKLSQSQQAANLRKFFAHGVNSVTRERIFFNRLAFDLKIAAAQADYHLHLYEPDVDRDGFDIVVEDQDEGMGWFQLKAVLRSAATSSWGTSVGFLRPPISIGEKLRFDPVECGRGGGMILIEIDDTTPNGDVVYSYTDYRVLTILAERYLVNDLAKSKAKGRGRRPTPRDVAAAAVIARIRSGARDDILHIPRKAFLELNRPDALLALMALRSSAEYAPFSVQNAYYDGVEIDANGLGVVRGDQSLQPLGNLYYHMQALSQLLSSNEHLKAFEFTSPYASSTQAI